MTLAELREQLGGTVTPIEFDEYVAQLECKSPEAHRALYRGMGSEELQRGVYCRECGDTFQAWLSKQDNKVGKGRRPKLREGLRDEVWEAFGNRCFHCGCEAHFLDAIGVERTIQHVPPYVVVGHEAWFYPYCSWCNQDAAGRWKRWEAMATRLDILDYFRAGIDP